jgi:hypothetical protein
MQLSEERPYNTAVYPEYMGYREEETRIFAV